MSFNLLFPESSSCSRSLSLCSFNLITRFTCVFAVQISAFYEKFYTAKGVTILKSTTATAVTGEGGKVGGCDCTACTGDCTACTGLLYCLLTR